MADDPGISRREERLAAQLRANLKRRKAQARQLARRPEPGESGPGPQPGDGDRP